MGPGKLAETISSHPAFKAFGGAYSTPLGAGRSGIIVRLGARHGHDVFRLTTEQARAYLAILDIRLEERFPNAARVLSSEA